MGYTVKDIRRAGYFMLNDNYHFDELTQVGERHKIYHEEDNTYYLNKYAGIEYILKDNEIEPDFTCAIFDGHIQFHQRETETTFEPEDISSQPNLFNIIEIEKLHHTEPQEYYVTTKVDVAGLKWLETKQTDVECLAEIATLHNQRDIIDRRIEELQDKLND